MTDSDTTEAATDRVAGRRLASALRVLDNIACHYGSFQYKHIPRPVSPAGFRVSDGDEELRRVISAIELLLINNGIGVIDGVTGEYRSLQK